VKTISGKRMCRILEQRASLQLTIRDTVRTPHVVPFDPADAGKTAHDWSRWENTRAETGPWSAPVSATIVG
jgi:hypothetical protein